MRMSTMLARITKWLSESGNSKTLYARLGLEWLESRVVPSYYTYWTGNVDNNWGTAGNWTSGTPGPNADAILRITRGTTNTAPTIKAGESYIINSLTDDTTFAPAPCSFSAP